MKTSEEGARSIFKYILSNCHCDDERVLVYEQWLAEYQLCPAAEGHADVLQAALRAFPTHRCARGRRTTPAHASSA